MKSLGSVERSVIQTPSDLDVNRPTALILLPRPPNYVPKQVHFAPLLSTTPQRSLPPQRTAYKVCNTLIEWYPHEYIHKATNQDHHNGPQYGTLNSGATKLVD